MSFLTPNAHGYRAEYADNDAQSRVAALNARFRDKPAETVLEYALRDMGHVALVSSFGAEAVALLHMAAQIDQTVPVLFLDTEMLFAETLAYQREVTRYLGLTGVLILRAGDAAVWDPSGDLHKTDTDACCALRKTAPLRNALRGFDGWITGRKRFQSGTRAALDYFDHDPGTSRIKVNPLAHWSPADVRAYMDAHDVPRHPLVTQGYPSIGCAPCTSPVEQGEDPRAGRWRNEEKAECGIHFVNGKPVRTGASA